YIGPATDTVQWVARNFVLNGSGGNTEKEIIYLKSGTGAWRAIDTVQVGTSGGSWSAPISLPGSDTIYFLAVAQINPNSGSLPTTMEPSFVMSQAGANILRVASSSTQCPCISKDMRQGLVAYWPFCN